jgi:tetratricopeptide (TPR) repeat protein
MSRAIGAFVLALGFASISAGGARAAEDTFSDVACPQVTQSVRTYDGMKKDQSTSVDAMIASLKKIMDLYDLCAAERLTDSAEVLEYAGLGVGHGVEGSHYAQVREAQFAVVLGRLYRLLEDYPDARSAFERALKLVEATIEFKESTQTANRSNNVHRGSASAHRASSDFSNYREAALLIRESAQTELGRTPKPSPGLRQSGVISNP